MTKSTGYDELLTHLAAVQQGQSKALDDQILDAAALTLVPVISPDQRKHLIFQIYALIPFLQQDPSALIQLLNKLLDPVPLSDVLAFEPPVDFIAGLDLDSQPFNVAILNLLGKATVVEAERLITQQPELLTTLIQLWLCTEDGGVALQASAVLYGWLRADWTESRRTEGLGGSIWKRVFRDKDTYDQILSTCSTKRNDAGVRLSKSRKTIAQARLLDLLPSVASLDWKTVTQSYHPELEVSYGLKSGHEGLLDYASLYMVDIKDDVLMHRTLIDFFAKLLTRGEESETVPSTTTLALDYLISRGLHDRTLRYYTEPDHPSHDPIDSTFLTSPAANYIATCLEFCPEHFLNKDDSTKPIMRRIQQALNNMSSARWAHNQAPVDDLHVLACVPRSLFHALGRDNPILLIPTHVANRDSLNTLATIFHGPLRSNEVRYPPAPAAAEQDKTKAIECQGAADLYAAYASHNPGIWSDVVRHASTIALGDAALAAVNLVKAVITANWSPSNPVVGVSDQSDNDIIMTDGPTKRSADPMSSAIFSDTASAKATIIPFLLSPPKTFGNLVGGHGDAESAAYKVAVAKFDCLRALYDRIKTSEEYMDIAALARERLNEGVMGKGAEVGGRIATLEL